MQGCGQILRIAHIPGFISSKYGGFERFLVCLAREARARGNSLYCVWEDEPRSETFSRDMRESGAKSVVIPARRQNLAFIRKIVGWLYENKINVIHTHFNPASFLGITAAALLGVPVRISTIHSGLWDSGGNGFGLKSRVVAVTNQMLSTRVMFVSQAILEQYQRVGLTSSKSYVHYLGIAAPRLLRDRASLRQELGFSAGDCVIACVAFHGPVKGVDIALHAISLLVDNFPNLRFLQIGGSSNAAEMACLTRLAESLGIAGRVVWAGYRNDVSDLLSCADIYLQPSRAEGLGLAILEAMSVGLPVVATRVGGIPEAVADGETGILVPPEAAAVAAALKALLLNKEMRDEMGQRGRARCLATFNLDNQVRTLLDLYERLLQRGNRFQGE